MIDCLDLRDQGGLVRIGMAPYNIKEELDRVIDALSKGLN
jgi:selenocysteine lyase/cysteine desulfurase